MVACTPSRQGYLKLLSFFIALLGVSWVGAQTGTIYFENLVQSYDGTGKLPKVVTDPPGLAVEWQFVDPSASAEPVYSNIPSSLDLSYQSLSFSAQRTSAVGDLVQPEESGRELEAIEMVFVTWAKATDYPSWATANPQGWSHPVTMAIYSQQDDGSLNTVAEVTETVFIPWRPEFQPDGSPYPFNGFAFRVSLDFPEGLVIPDNAMVMVAFNTQSHGFEPIGEPGPYNQLNVAMTGYPATVGSNVDFWTVLWVRNNVWSYPTPFSPDPFLTIHARSDGISNQPPVHAGTYSVTATIAEPGFSGQASATLTIEPASAEVTLGDLVQAYDGGPKPVTVTTNPADLPVTLTYDALNTVPSALGNYAVSAVVNDPNYFGEASGILKIGHTFASWLQPLIDNSSIPPAEAGMYDDTDQDLLPHLLEYAYKLDPTSPLGGSGSGSTGGSRPVLPHLEDHPDGMNLVYRRNPQATDLVYDVMTADSFLPNGQPDWQPTPAVHLLLEEASGVEIMRAVLPPELSNLPRLLVKLRVTRTD